MQRYGHLPEAPAYLIFRTNILARQGGYPDPPWELNWSDEYNIPYYWNSATGSSTWENPCVKRLADPAVTQSVSENRTTTSSPPTQPDPPTHASPSHGWQNSGWSRDQWEWNDWWEASTLTNSGWSQDQWEWGNWWEAANTDNSDGEWVSGWVS